MQAGWLCDRIRAFRSTVGTERKHNGWVLYQRNYVGWLVQGL